MGDRAEVLDQLGVRHADAEVLDREGPGLVVGCQVDLQRQAVVENLLLHDLKVAHFLERVGGIGDQLPHEDLLLRVERVDDDIEQLADFGLELEFLWRGHGSESESERRGEEKGKMEPAAIRTTGRIPRDLADKIAKNRRKMGRGPRVVSRCARSSRNQRWACRGAVRAASSSRPRRADVTY